MLQFIFIFLIIPSMLQKGQNVKKCQLPISCRIDSFHYLENYWAYEYVSNFDKKGIICDVKTNKFRFEYEKWLQGNHYKACNHKRFIKRLELRFPRNYKHILDEKLNFQGIIDFLNSFAREFSLQSTHLRGFNIELGIRKKALYTNYTLYANYYINFIDSKIDFYSKGKLVESCQDLIASSGRNLSINSIFQLTPGNESPELLFLKCQFR